MAEALRNFDIAFEQDRAQRLDNIVSFEEYRIRREELVSYNKDQIKTALGERFNVILSTYQYEIRNGELWGKDMDEPFMESLIRGRNYRREHGNAVDFRREDAEVKGFRKIQEIMTDSNTPDGTIVLSISPPGLEGSTYKHNFIDIHTKKSDETGRAYMESQRVSSGLTVDDYKEKISAFTTLEIDDSDPAASFLENPIAIANTLTTEDLKYYLYKDHEYMEENTFEVILENVKHLTDEFAESIVYRPNDVQSHKLIYNALLNKADYLADMIREKGIVTTRQRVGLESNTYKDLQDYGYKNVREIKAGCGLSGGYELEAKDSAFSVNDFGAGKDKYGERAFKCPSCNKENIRPFNKLIPRCQHCRSTKVAC